MRRLLHATLAALGGAALLPLLLIAVLAAGPTVPAHPAAPPVSPPGEPAARAGVSDGAQVAAAPPALRGHFVAAARRVALPPALLVAAAQAASGFDPDKAGPAGGGGRRVGLMQLTRAEWDRHAATPTTRAATQTGGPGRLGDGRREPGPAVLAGARLLLAAGTLPGGGWDAARALAGHPALAGRAGQVLADAAGYGYRYSPAGPPHDPARYVFPLAGPASYGPGHHDYPATDIFTPRGTPVVACVRAAVLRLSPAEVGLGGVTVTLRGEDGWRYYYAHLSALAPGLAPGQVLEAGGLLGWSGDTGNARGTDPHLHLGITRTGTAAGQLDPYPYLRAWPVPSSAPPPAPGPAPKGRG